MAGDRPENEQAALPDEDKALKRRRWWSTVLLLAYLLTNLGAIAAVAVTDYYANRDIVSKLSDDVLHSTESLVLSELESFLSSASSTADFLARVAKDREANIFVNGGDVVDRVASDLLRSYDQLAMFNIADTRGQFIMPKKMPDGSIHTKLIRVRDGVREVSWTKRNAAGEVTEVEQVEGDTYDPRTRPWCQGAMKKRGIFWTDVYVFFTDKQPGVTAAAPLVDSRGEVVGVLGLDIELKRLSDFLARLNISENGMAVIVSENGTLVAHPDASKTIRVEGDKHVPASVSESSDRHLKRAFDRHRLHGPGRHVLNVGGERFISLSASLPASLGQSWAVLITVPEEDFAGIAAANSQRSIGLATGAFVISSVLALLVFMQGARTDRLAQRAITKTQRLEDHALMLAEVAGRASTTSGDGDTGDSRLANAAAVVGVNRVSLWEVRPEEGNLHLLRYFDGAATVEGRLSVSLADAAAFVALKDASAPVPVHDAMQDPRTRGLVSTYLRAEEVRSMLVAPILSPSGADHLLVFERTGKARRWRSEQVRFASTAARVFAKQRAGATPASTGPPPAQAGTGGQTGSAGAVDSERSVDLEATAELDARRQAVRERLQQQSMPPPAPTDRVLDQAVCMMAVVEPTYGKGGPAQMQKQLATYRAFFEVIGEAYPCIKSQWLGDRFIAVVDGASDLPAAVRQVAQMAMCVLGEWPSPVDDHGDTEQGENKPRIGVEVGRLSIEDQDKIDASNGHGQPVGLLLASECVQRARVLAETAPVGEVQVSAAVRTQLPESVATYFRGRFLTPEHGEIEVYKLSREKR